MSSPISNALAITPCQTMRGHTAQVRGIVHLPGERQIITCSVDGSLRLWDLERGVQIREEWRDESDVWSIALSPNGKIIASGGGDQNVRLWNVETRKIIAKWTGHSNVVCTLGWSGDGERVASGSWDGTARVWDVDSGKTDSSKLATGGDEEDAVKIWDAKTGKCLKTLEHRYKVCSLTWTSDGKKLVSGSNGPIRIFDTATWQQIATLGGHIHFVTAISLSPNNRLLASVSNDRTTRLWNLDTNLPVGPPIYHEEKAFSTAVSRVLVTSCEDNTYTWDIHAILKYAGLEDLLPIGNDIAPKDTQKQKAPQDDSVLQDTAHTARSSLSDRSFLEADATGCANHFGGVDELSPAFFAGMEADIDSSPMSGAHSHSSVNAFLARLSSLLHRFRPENDEAIELPQPSRPSVFALLARLSSFIHSSPPENDAPDELQSPSMSSQSNLRVLLGRISSLFPRSQLNTSDEAEAHPTIPSSSHPDALRIVSQLSSFFRSRPRISDEFELSQRPMYPHVVEVSAMRDREVLFVSEPLPNNRAHTQPTGTALPGARPAHSLPIRMLAHLLLFLCCASPQHVDGNPHSTQHQQGQLHAQASPSQTQPVAPSTSATLAALNAHPAALGAVSGQPRPLPLRTRFVLFLCCASPPHADGH